MKNKAYKIILTVVLLIMIIISFLWVKWQWNLCCNEGFDFWYCVQHIL